MDKNQQIALDVLKAVGGKDNVTFVTHCMTRLRFNLKDESIVSDDEVKAIKGVMGVAHSGGQYQCIVGQNVPKVYEFLCKEGGFKMEEAIDENLDGPKEKLTPKVIGSKILNYLSGSMTPLIPVMMAAGLCKALCAVLGPDLLKVLAEDSDLYIILDFLYDAGFYFLPILVGFNAAKKLGLNQLLGAYMGCILMAPDFAALAATEGASLHIFGVGVTLADYSQTVLPVLLCIPVMALLYKYIAKIMPDSLTTIFTPLLTVLLTTPLALCLLAPMGTFAGNFLCNGLVWVTDKTGFLGFALIGGIWEFLVMTGMHMVVLMPFLTSYFMLGYQTGAIMGAACATWAAFGVALGAFLRIRNKENKQMALGCFISGLVGGVTEPTIFGLCFKYKRLFGALVAGGAVGGAWMGITKVCSYVMGSSNFLSLIAYTGGSQANLINGCVACIASMIVSAIVAYLFGFTKEEVDAD